MAYKRKYSNRRFKKRATRLGRRTRRAPRTFKARVTQVLMKKVETKMFNFAQENIQLQHNIGRNSNAAPPLITFSSMSNFFNLWAGIGKGTASWQRIGDRITPRGMLLKIFLANKSDRPNCMHRIIIARVPKAINATATLVDNVDPFEKTLQLGTNGNKLLMNPDKDRGIKFLYDKIHQISPSLSTDVPGNRLVEKTKLIRIYIKSNKSRDIVYDSTGSSQIVNNPILLWIIPYEQYSTLETDIVASATYEGKLYYKDV